jgi:AhpD family alkylhydroperoxidase
MKSVDEITTFIAERIPMAKETPWYLKHSEEVGKGFAEFYKAATSKGVLDDKTRELLMLALASTQRCPHCTEAHIKQALEVGASKAEVTEALLIAAVEGAGTQLMWCKDIYEEHLGDESD